MLRWNTSITINTLTDIILIRTRGKPFLMVNGIRISILMSRSHMSILTIPIYITGTGMDSRRKGEGEERGKGEKEKGRRGEGEMGRKGKKEKGRKGEIGIW